MPVETKLQYLLIILIYKQNPETASIKNNLMKIFTTKKTYKFIIVSERHLEKNTTDIKILTNNNKQIC